MMRMTDGRKSCRRSKQLVPLKWKLVQKVSFQLSLGHRKYVDLETCDHLWKGIVSSTSDSQRRTQVLLAMPQTPGQALELGGTTPRSRCSRASSAVATTWALSIGLERRSGWSMWRWVFELEAALSWAVTACAKPQAKLEGLAK